MLNTEKIILNKKQLIEDQKRDSNMMNTFILIGSIVVIISIIVMDFSVYKTITVPPQNTTSINFGNIKTNYIIMFIGALFFGGIFGGLFIMYPKNVKKKANKATDIIANDQFVITIDKVIGKHIDSHQDSDGYSQRTLYITGKMSGHHAIMSYPEYTSTKEGDTLYIIHANTGETMKVYTSALYELSAELEDKITNKNDIMLK